MSLPINSLPTPESTQSSKETTPVEEKYGERRLEEKYGERRLEEKYGERHIAEGELTLFCYCCESKLD